MKPVWGAGVVVLLAGGLVGLAYAPLWVARPVETICPGDFPARDLAGSFRPPVDPRVVLAGSDPWPPVAGRVGHDTPGYAVELLRLALEPFGYQVRYVNRPWVRCLEEVRDGRLTVVVGAEIEDAPDLLYPRQPIGWTRPLFYVRRGSGWRFSDLADLDQVRLGVIDGYFYGGGLDERIARAMPGRAILVAHGNDSLERLIRALAEGRVDTLVENAAAFHHTLARLGLPADAFQAAGALKAGGWLQVGFSRRDPRSPELCRLFDDRLTELRQSGAVAALLARYGVPDWLTSEADAASDGG